MKTFSEKKIKLIFGSKSPNCFNQHFTEYIVVPLLDKKLVRVVDLGIEFFENGQWIYYPNCSKFEQRMAFVNSSKQIGLPVEFDNGNIYYFISEKDAIIQVLKNC